MLQMPFQVSAQDPTILALPTLSDHFLVVVSPCLLLCHRSPGSSVTPWVRFGQTSLASGDFVFGLHSRP